MFRERLLDKLNQKFGRYSIRNLMTFIVGGMTVVYLAELLLYPVTGFSLSSVLAFNRNAVLHGQIWRLITFIFIPPDSSILFILFSLYFYWLIGNALENQWGAFRFNLYYLCGMVCTAIAGMITGYATNSYLNLSMFLAFALMYPDYQVMVFFILPVKMKYLALLDVVGLVIMFIMDSWTGRIALLFSLGNVILFFWRNFIDGIQNAKRRYEWRKNNGNNWR
ncbi:MAG: rhomboid family intramembrane serine protease [Firmicutes bacterium]|nr:rhomboid family intramembrane serine protease [Bacillota bacterium]